MLLFHDPLFGLINVVKLVPYYTLGLLRISNITTILLLAPLAYIGVRLGVYLNKRFTDKWFTRFVYAFLFITGMELLTGSNLVDLVLTLW